MSVRRFSFTKIKKKVLKINIRADNKEYGKSDLAKVQCLIPRFKGDRARIVTKFFRFHDFMPDYQILCKYHILAIISRPYIYF